MLQIKTYKNSSSQGVYSQLKLENGDNVFISIAMSGVRISKVNFIGFPTKIIWESNNLEEAMLKFTGDRNTQYFFLLDSVIHYLDSCSSIEDVKIKLNH